jgi:hypothetical protein
MSAGRENIRHPDRRVAENIEDSLYIYNEQ